MTIAGPSYECLYADVGTNGRVNPGGAQRISVVLIGDHAFALKFHLMKPYPQ